MTRPDVISAGTSGALIGVGAMHVAWGLGSTWPFRDATQLADLIVGSPTVPPPAACFAVAGALGAAAALVSGIPAGSCGVRKLGQAGVASVFAARAVIGFAGRTDIAVPGSASPQFRRWDRRLYSPFCLALAAGVARSLTR